MTGAPTALSRIDDGTARPGDDLIAAVFDAHASDEWYRRELLLDTWQSDVCVICGQTGDGVECGSCTSGWDVEVARSADV